MSELKLIHQENEDGGGFYLKAADKILGEITYKRDGDTNLIFDRTWVDDSLRGQGRAGELFGAAMTWVRENNHKVVPVCSYVVARFERDDSLADIKA